MEALIESIRAALAPEASPEARTSGAEACHRILTALEPAGGAVAGTAATPDLIATIAAAVRGMSADQLLDVAIAKLRAVVPAGTEPLAVAPLKFHLVPIPGAKR
jgi:hypothetical protein